MTLDNTTGLLLLMGADIVLMVLVVVALVRKHRPRSRVRTPDEAFYEGQQWETGDIVPVEDWDAYIKSADRNRQAFIPSHDTHTGDDSLPDEIRRRLNDGDAA